MPRTPGKPSTAPATPAARLTQHDRIEALLVGIGARMTAAAGKLNKYGTGLSVTFWICPNGKPLILQQTRGGGVDVYLQASDSARLVDIETAIARYAENPALTHHSVRGAGASSEG